MAVGQVNINVGDTGMIFRHLLEVLPSARTLGAKLGAELQKCSDFSELDTFPQSRRVDSSEAILFLHPAFCRLDQQAQRSGHHDEAAEQQKNERKIHSYYRLFLFNPAVPSVT